MTEDMASTWGDWGVSSEIGKLHAVLLRRPGSELDAVVDFNAMQMRSDLSPDRVREQHDALADAYRAGASWSTTSSEDASTNRTQCSCAT